MSERSRKRQAKRLQDMIKDTKTKLELERKELRKNKYNLNFSPGHHGRVVKYRERRVEKLERKLDGLEKQLREVEVD